MSRRRATLLATLIALAIGAVAGPARAACPETAVSQPFASWGDGRDYIEVPGGTFERSLSWDAVGTPLLVDAAGLGWPGSRALRLHAGESITSPSLCVTRLYPHLRFLARAVDRRSHLLVEAMWLDGGGEHVERVLAPEVSRWHRSWAPSRDIALRKVLPRDLGDVRDVRVRLSVQGGVGDWLVDDVYVDPVKRG